MGISVKIIYKLKINQQVFQQSRGNLDLVYVLYLLDIVYTYMYLISFKKIVKNLIRKL